MSSKLHIKTYKIQTELQHVLCIRYLCDVENILCNGKCNVKLASFIILLPYYRQFNLKKKPESE